MRRPIARVRCATAYAVTVYIQPLPGVLEICHQLCSIYPSRNLMILSP
jgi:hypothetical protein